MFRLRKYIYTDKKHTAKGIFGTVLAVLSLAVFVLAIYISFINGGQAELIVTSFGLASMGLAVIGLAVSFLGFGEKEKYYIFSKIGAISNMLLLFLWICIFLIGM